MSLITWEELHRKEYPETSFLLDPYIPRGGVVLFWGDTSIGKSPITWEMARAIGEGTHFFGLPAEQGRVLYLEVDTPEHSQAERLKVLRPAHNVWWLFMEPLSFPAESRQQVEELREAERIVKPDLVIIDTLRKVHDLDDRESQTPKLVYSWFKGMFPGAALLFVHHIRKQPTDPRVTENNREAFSGSKALLNDSQVGMYLGTFAKRDGRENLRLYHEKSQVSEIMRPLRLKLHSDGSTVSSPEYDELLTAYSIMNEEEGLSGAEIDRRGAEKMGVSASTMRSRRLIIEAGLFPGSRKFLSLPPGEEEID